MRKEYVKLGEALASVAAAKACIAQNRGYDKHLAHEAHEHVIAEELCPAIVAAVHMVIQDLPPRDVVRLAKYVNGFVELV